MFDETEAFNTLWFRYPSDLCNNKRGGKQPALQAFKKLKLDQDQFDKLLLSMDAQIRADRKDPDHYRWPFVSTYLNQRRFDDVIIQSESRPITHAICCKCTREVHGSRFKHCTEHLPDRSPLIEHIRHNYKEKGLVRGKDESKEEHLARCRQLYKESLGKLL